MDSKTQSELRRRKILANAEVRLRKIRRITLEDLDKEPDEHISQVCETNQNVLDNEAEINECTKQVQIEPLYKCTSELECENRLIDSSPLSNGAFNTIIIDLREDELQFFNYFWMSIQSFDELAARISDALKRQENAVRDPMLPLEISSEPKLTETQLEPLIKNILCNGSLKKSDEFSAADEPNHQNSTDSLSLENLDSLFALSQSPKKHPAYFDIFIFVFLGILIRFLYFLGLSSVFQNNLMGPFLVVCLPRMILYIWQKPEMPMVYSLIIFFGIPERKLKMPFRVYSCLRTAIQYLVLYLFSFFVTHFVIKNVKL